MFHFHKHHVKRTLLGLLGITLLAGSLTACGHHHGEYGANMTAEEFAHKRDKVVNKVASRLDLNDAQKQKLAALGDVLHAQRQAMMGQSQDPRAEFKALIATDKFDAARAQSLVNEKANAVQARSPEVIAALAAFYDSLNPTQQQKVREYLDGRGHWFHRG